MAMPVTRYAKSGDVHIAYQVFGSGPIDLVLIPGFVSHIENYWDQPDFARWLLRLAGFARVVMFDKRGTGLSDRVGELPALDQRMDDARAVMDAVGIERAALLGDIRRRAVGGPVRRNLSRAMPGAGALWRHLRASTSWIPTAEGLDALPRIHRSSLGERRHSDRGSRPSRQNDPALQQWCGRFERLGASPAAAIALMRMNSQIDISDILSSDPRAYPGHPHAREIGPSTWKAAAFSPSTSREHDCSSCPETTISFLSRNIRLPGSPTRSRNF